MANSTAGDMVKAEVLANLGSSADLIFENVFDLYGILDLEGHILDLKGKIFNETNAEPQLQIAQRFPDTIFWQSSENTPKLLERAISTAVDAGTSQLAIDFRVSADEKRPLEVNFQRIGDSIFVCGRRIYLSGGLPNMWRESEYYLLAAENADIGLWFWDDTEDRSYSTPRCNELFDLSAYEELTYEKFISAVHPDDRGFVNDLFDETRRKGTKYQEEFRVVSSDGSVDWLCAEGRSFLYEDGKPKKMVGVVRRITAEKEASAELERVYEREKKARDEAEIANRAKDFFLAFVSHELRSPLNAIIGWTNILKRDLNEDTRKKAIDTIEKSAQVQKKLINDLVDSVRVASGRLKLEYRPVNLVDIVRSTFEAQRPTA
ncbi:MAG: PAS domain-containing sensor histidine kinase, partial [Pyrinomonadaceae bacterium]|nr:PAS domain-containing sensor histidine kinase [Pyrinomonadaceae bacterium]